MVFTGALFSYLNRAWLAVKAKHFVPMQAVIFVVLALVNIAPLLAQEIELLEALASYAQPVLYTAALIVVGLVGCFINGWYVSHLQRQVREEKLRAAAADAKAARAKEEAQEALELAKAMVQETKGKMREENEHKLCLVCMDEPKRVIALPCGHGLACRNCSETLLQVRLDQPGGLLCLLCRAPVGNLHTVYLE